MARKKVRPVSTTLHRAKNYFRSIGMPCDVAERWVRGANVTKDLFEVVDLVVLDRDRCQTMGVQVTSSSNHAARRKKILEAADSRALCWCGWRLVVISFYPDPEKPPRIEDITIEMIDAHSKGTP